MTTLIYKSLHQIVPKPSPALQCKQASDQTVFSFSCMKISDHQFPEEGKLLASPLLGEDRISLASAWQS